MHSLVRFEENTSSTERRAVFLDRDGVINSLVHRDRREYPPHSLSEFRLLPGVAEAVLCLKEAGFFLIVVTNQPDVATGIQTRENLETIHAHLKSNLPIDDIRVCCHVDADNCACRKPKPGMLFDAARDWSICLDQSYVVGDRWRDIGAGKAANCRTILVGRDNGANGVCDPDEVVNSLFEAAKLIVSVSELG